jgi:hypothetical protein
VSWVHDWEREGQLARVGKQELKQARMHEARDFGRADARMVGGFF